MLHVKSPALEGISKEQVCVCVGGGGSAHVHLCFFPYDLERAIKRLEGGEFVFNRCVCLTRVLFCCS